MKYSYLLFIFVTVLLVGFSAFSFGAILDENTIAYWSFDEGEGDTLTDHSENGHHGTIIDAVWVNGKYENALEFNGETSFVEVPEAETLHTTDQTVAAWIKVLSNPGGWTGSNAAGIVFKMNEFQWNVENTGLLWYGIWGAALRSKYNFMDHVGEWHHTAITFEDGSKNCVIYVDGEVDAEGSVAESVDPSTFRLVIGGKDEPGGGVVEELFHGIIDEVEISSVVRTQDEIVEGMLSSLSVAYRDGKLTTTWGKLKRD
ncbi:hypothetical protein GF312_18150 [Candidatus Poribacteria bacterium]|nr:hypothetical protein [Candidatus Poribacteria bacterium]